MDGRCQQCYFWIEWHYNMGECHRSAPLPYNIYEPEDEIKSEDKIKYKGTRWPLTKGIQVCGEFRKKNDNN